MQHEVPTERDGGFTCFIDYQFADARRRSTVRWKMRFCLCDALIGATKKRLIDFWPKSAIWLVRLPHFSYMRVRRRRASDKSESFSARRAHQQKAEKTNRHQTQAGVFFVLISRLAPVWVQRARVFSWHTALLMTLNQRTRKSLPHTRKMFR